MLEGRKSAPGSRERWPLALLITGLIGLFLLGGSARSDTMSLILLRPLATIALAILLVTSLGTAFRQARSVVLLLGLSALLVALHLVPMPIALWSALPGRALAFEAATYVGLTNQWMPFSLSPIDGWNQLFALVVPMAVFLGMIWAGQRLTRNVAAAVIIIIFVSAIVGLLQSIGPANGPLYFYRITNEGAAVGLFANRNHQAMLLACVFPLLAAWTSTVTGSVQRRQAHTVAAAALGSAIVPMILVTGSRGGLVLGLVGLVAAFLVYRRPQDGHHVRLDTRSRKVMIGGGIVGAVALVVATALSTRATAVQRLLESDAADDLRFAVLPTLVDAFVAYLPLGSGAGSFVSLYKTIEPAHLLGPQYLNHAHNDVLETAIEFGLPGIMLMVAAVLGWATATYTLFRARRITAGRNDNERRFALAGSSILLILALGSLVDYPLRVPSLAGLAAIASVWLVWGAAGARNLLDGSDRGSQTTDAPLSARR